MNYYSSYISYEVLAELIKFKLDQVLIFTSIGGDSAAVFGGDFGARLNKDPLCPWVVGESVLYNIT